MKVSQRYFPVKVIIFVHLLTEASYSSSKALKPSSHTAY